MTTGARGSDRYVRIEDRERYVEVNATPRKVPR